MHDFLKVIRESSQSITSKTELFMSAVEGIIGASVKEPERCIPIIRYIERATGFEKGKGTKSKSVITIKEDIPDGEVEAALKTAELEPPRILVIKRGGAIIGIFISGDGVSIRCHTSTDKTVTSAIITLLGVYYVFHLEYPKMYSQLLGILQTHLLRGIPFDGKKSAKYRSFSTVLSKKLSE
ncbi:uncharacterized protein [Asterias amurensis]